MTSLTLADGFRFEDLYERAGLLRLDRCFLERVASTDESLARRLDARVVLPAYPLAPQWTWRDSHPAVLSLFEQLATNLAYGIASLRTAAQRSASLQCAPQ